MAYQQRWVRFTKDLHVVHNLARKAPIRIETQPERSVYSCALDRREPRLRESRAQVPMPFFNEVQMQVGHDMETIFAVLK
jgi:hypothetical protein